MVEKRLEDVFPALRDRPFAITSPQDDSYNCIAWAAGDSGNWWWPDPEFEDTWPVGVMREETVEAFHDTFATLGYQVCAQENVEPGFEKIALFALNGKPKHAARQLNDGTWTSKLGPMEDITHELHDLTGLAYGSVVLLMKRSRATANQSDVQE
jgi:hypothetical protein